MNVWDKKIIIVAHFFNTGPPQNFEEYLVKQKTAKVLAISHPLLYEEEGLLTEYRYYKRGRIETYQKISRKKQISVFLSYLWDVFFNIWRVWKTKEKWDFYLGADNLNALCGLVLKKLGRVKKVAYYSIDFIPQRFDNKILNEVYRCVEKFCVKYCDEIWNLSPRMAEGREKLLGLSVEKYGKKQKLVPEGAWMERTKQYPLEKINWHHLVFVGHIVERMGVQIMIRAMPEIIKVIPDLKFIIIGKGAYRESLEDLARGLGVSGHLDFKGFVEDHKEVENIIARCSIGVATYLMDDGSLIYYADPGKTKIYMSAGVPVIMTDLFYNAYEVQDAKGGIVVNNDEKEIAQAVIRLMQDRETFEQYRKGAMDYMMKLDWNVVFENRLKELFENDS